MAAINGRTATAEALLSAGAQLEAKTNGVSGGCVVGEGRKGLKYELVEQRPYKENLRPQIHWLRDQQGQVDMSFIGRFERLEADFQQLCEVLGVEVVLPHRTASLPKMDYRMQYTDELAEIVQDFYWEDITYFNYSFDG